MKYRVLKQIITELKHLRKEKKEKKMDGYAAVNKNVFRPYLNGITDCANLRYSGSLFHH